MTYVTWLGQGSRSVPSWGGPGTSLAAPRDATYLRRVGAALIDLALALLCLFATLFGYAVAAGIVGTSDSFDDRYGIPGAAILGLAAGALLPVALMVRRGASNGQTLGKELLGLRVVPLDGQPVGPVTAVVRELFGKVALGVTLVWIVVDALWPLVDGRRQALHDKLVATVVRDARTGMPRLLDPFGR